MKKDTLDMIPISRAKGSMTFTEAELQGYSEEHLLYELRMLFETANRLVDDQSYSNDVVTENALLESFAVHARSLADFLCGTRQQDDDILATDYIDATDLQRWPKLLGDLPPLIKDAKRRTNKEIAHLTVVRRHPADLQKGWDVRAILEAFIAPFRTFETHAKPSRLHEKVRLFIRNDLRLPSGTPTRQRLYHSTSSTAIIWGKILPDDPPRITAKTDTVLGGSEASRRT